jgi:hypothetical protein
MQTTFQRLATAALPVLFALLVLLAIASEAQGAAG